MPNGPPKRVGLHREHDPVGLVHHALHAFIVRRQAVPGVHPPEPRREHRGAIAGHQQHQQPRARRPVARVQQRQQRPQGERHRNQRPRPQRLADDERVHGAGRHDERRQEEQAEHAEQREPQHRLPTAGGRCGTGRSRRHDRPCPAAARAHRRSPACLIGPVADPGTRASPSRSCRPSP